MHALIRLSILSLMLILIVLTLSPASARLEDDFRNPPDSARPWAYWFWLNGNITREGITADLEAMQRVGIGGVLIMEVDQGAPLGPIPFMSPEWRELFRHVISEAKRLGLEVNMNNDAGWNGSGGPWIRPEQSMQKVVFTEIEVSGPSRIHQTIPQPQTIAGFYRDIAVLAMPSPGSYRIPDIQHKAAYAIGHVPPPSSDVLPPDMVIDKSRIIDITASMQPDGTIDWNVPDGKWTIIRFGHTSTGAQNGPAHDSGRGLECDKLSKEGAEANFRGMMAKLVADTDSGHSALVATHVDSWEIGSQNWTSLMREEFRRRRGYEILPFLPVMTGRVVGSLEISERFLWDLRRTISELVVENYAGHIRKLANDAGLRFTIEAYGSPCDNLPYAGQADEPMGEFWTPSGAMETCKAMASAGHVYGKRIIGAEAFTSGDHERWREHPGSIKAIGDQAFCEGINRLVFHRYALQPWNPVRFPGMTMGPWGQHYERTNTWWEETPAWHRYLARCQYMLRLGRFVADICYVQAESPFNSFRGLARRGYEWDECPAEVVLERMSVRDGRIILPEGLSYRLLVLPDTRVMTPRLLRKIGELARAGATVVGPPPLRSPSLTDYPACDDEVRRLSAEIWGDCDGVRVREHHYGKGRVIWGLPPERALALSGVRPDFIGPDGMRYIHRTLGNTDIYFVSNQQPFAITSACRFRVQGKVPEFWDPETGRIQRAAAFEENDAGTSVVLSLGPRQSVFVVFRKSAIKPHSIRSVAVNGRIVVSAVPEPQKKIIVTRAVYGVPGDPKLTRDVRELVQSRADSGEYSFPVSAMAEEGDPAFGVVKTLTVEYECDGRSFRVTGRDGDLIRLSTDTLDITILSASYGVPGDPKRTVDVKDKVQRLVDSGQLSFRVSQMAADYDPAYMVVKTLVIEYTLNGERRAASATDPETIRLTDPVGGPVPPCELSTDGSRLVLIAWEPGRFEATDVSGAKREVLVPSLPSPISIGGPWELNFPAGLGAPDRIALDKLISWTEHSDPGVRYFSGTATYRTSFTVPDAFLRKANVFRLDLGDVQVIARVKLNGEDLGTLWKPPFVLDVTQHLRHKNELEVRVTNLWPNRMIGDEQLPEDSDRNPNGTLKSWPTWLLEGKPSPTGRYTFTTWRLWKKDDPLLKSGLIGPVTLHAGHAVVME